MNLCIAGPDERNVDRLRPVVFVFPFVVHFRTACVVDVDVRADPALCVAVLQDALVAERLIQPAPRQEGSVLNHRRAAPGTDALDDLVSPFGSRYFDERNLYMGVGFTRDASQRGLLKHIRFGNVRHEQTNFR